MYCLVGEYFLCSCSCSRPLMHLLDVAFFIEIFSPSDSDTKPPQSDHPINLMHNLGKYVRLHAYFCPPQWQLSLSGAGPTANMYGIRGVCGEVPRTGSAATSSRALLSAPPSAASGGLESTRISQ